MSSHSPGLGLTPELEHEFACRGEPCPYKFGEAKVSPPVILLGPCAQFLNPHGISLRWESSSYVKLIMIKQWAQLSKYKNHC